MGTIIRDHISSIVQKKFNACGIVVWYDPEKYYGTMIESPGFSSAPVLKFEGSYFQLRYKAEEYLNRMERTPLLIYINNFRDNENHPLIELEKAGCVIEPGAPRDNNSSLSVIVKRCFKNIIPPESVKEICQKIDQNVITIDEIETLAENAGSIDIGILSTVFNTNNSQLMLLSFITNDFFDNQIEQKKLIEKLTQLINLSLGIETDNKSSLSDIRFKVIEKILLVDFLQCLKDEEFKNKFKELLPNEKFNREILDLVSTWRKRVDLSEQYVLWSKKVQKKYRLEAEQFALEALSQSDTFPFVDSRLLSFILEIDIESDLNTTDILISKRKQSFWCKDKLDLLWSLFEYCIKMLLQIKEHSNSFINLTVNEFIELYVGSERSDGLYLIDSYYRFLELKYSDYLDFDNTHEFSDKLEKFITKCRRAYQKFLDAQITGFTSAVKKEKGISKANVLQQTDVFNKKTFPILCNKDKCAYFLIDAFRYEMGIDLLNLDINNCHIQEISPALASVPTITPTGMASLLIVDADKITLNSNAEKFEVKAGDLVIHNRSDRIDYMKKRFKGQSIFLDLEDIYNPNKNTKEKVKNSDLIIVTSQEIDEVYESGNELIANRIVKNILIDIRKAIYNLVGLGVGHFVISSDHGFLLMNELGKEAKIEVPSGESLLQKKRVWIGKGGNNPKNSIRFKASEFGYCDDETDFLFPQNASIFKTPGKESNFFHGGLSLQEMIVPVIQLEMKPVEQKKNDIKDEFLLTMSKENITNRIFTINLDFKPPAMLFDDLETRAYKTRINVSRKKEQVGRAVTAKYGFNDTTNEIELIKNQQNTITIILDENIIDGKCDLSVIDVKNEIELINKRNISIDITI